MVGDFSRRTLLAGLMVSGCGRKRGPRYQGWLFVASGGEKEIAVADLASFRRVATIPLPFAPDQLFQSQRRVFAICREAQAIVEIDTDRFRFAGKIGLAGKPVAARLLPDSSAVIILTDEPATLLKVDLAGRRVAARVPLPGTPGDMDLNGPLAAITIPGRNSVVRVILPEVKLAGMTDTAVPCNPVRFRKDGKTILAGATADREIIAIDAQTGHLLTRLPLPLTPSRLCLNLSGGEMFVTGKGEDSLAIVSSFQNEVEQTILAGRTPLAMAVSDRRNLLFVTNPESGDLTIIDIETRRVAVSVHVGENPGEILLTPDEEYALVLDQRSGNVSVVRITTVLDHKIKTNSPPSPLFTVFATAADARSAIIVPFPG